MPCSMNRFLETVAPYRLYDEQQEDVSVQELKKKEPWKISDKQFEAFRLKVCLSVPHFWLKEEMTCIWLSTKLIKNFFFIYSLREK